MIRIFLPLVLAIVAFFGPWAEGGLTGQGLSGAAVDCVTSLDFSDINDCKPRGPLSDQLIGYTVIGAALAAVLSIIGLLPIIGRLTSIVVLAAGLLGTAAGATAITSVFTDGAGMDVLAKLWGAYGGTGLSLITAWAGLDGVRNGNDG